MVLEKSLFTKPEELVAWLEETAEQVQVNLIEATLLLDYLEGHDYAIGINDNNQLIRKDVASEDGEMDLYSIDEVIDCVCDWNYELKLDADVRRNNPDNFIQYVNDQNRYEKLVQDEAILDGLFNRTKYRVQCVDYGKELANDVITNLIKSRDNLPSKNFVLECNKAKVDFTNNRSR